jgi:hypothetical protein
MTAGPKLRMYNGLALALLGRKAEALRELARAKLRPLAQDPGGGPYDRYILAKTYAMVGEPDRALDMFEDWVRSHRGTGRHQPSQRSEC